jgi:hypothetical protein
MNAKLLITAVGSLLVGLGLGFVIFHAEAPTELQPSARSGPPPSSVPATVERALVVPAAVTPPSPEAPVPAPALAPAAPSAQVEPTPAVLALEAKVDDLERQLHIERAIRKGTEGERIEPPPNLAPRFRDERQLLTTFNAAIKAAGFPGQVSNIDCTEHPCLVFGTGFGEYGDLQKLKGRLGPYEHDSFSTFGFETNDRKKEHHFFGVAVMPETRGPPDEAMEKRVRYRVHQMREASKPGPAPKP